MDGRVVEVVKVLDQWFGADYRYCKVKGADCALYILRLDENRSDWTLTMYASPEAQTRAPQSGVNMRSNGYRLTTYRLIAAAQPRNGDLTAVGPPEAGDGLPT